MQVIIDILVFAFILGSIIIIHELGHFLAAKYFGVYCSQFSIGFGPKIYSRKGKETTFEIRALPIGGFVAMAGEEDQADNEDMKDVPIERTLKGKKAYQKIIIFLAGVFMNFVLAIVVIFGVNVTTGQVAVNTAEIGIVSEGSAAEKSGLQVGDVIQQVDIVETGESFIISDFNEVSFSRDNLKTTADSITMNITVERSNEKKVIPVKVNYNEANHRYTIGISQATRNMTFVESVKGTFTTFGVLSVAIIGAIGQLITNFAGTVTQLSGPVGIYQMTSEITRTGQVSYLLNFLAMLSINVGLFNLMPIPGLDGCQVLFAAVEKIIGRELPQKLKMILQMIGLGLVLLLMAIVIFQDISRIIG